MNRSLRITLLTVLAVALVAAGAVGGALYAHEDPKDPKKFSEMAGRTVCSASEPVLERVVPDAPYADSWSRQTQLDKLRYNATCRIAVDGKQVLRVTVEQRDVAYNPQRRGTGPGHGKTRSIPGYKQSWSSQDVAGFSVPCTKKRGNDDATRLYVRAQAWRKNYPELREDMVRIAKQAIKNNRVTACVTQPVSDSTT